MNIKILAVGLSLIFLSNVNAHEIWGEGKYKDGQCALIERNGLIEVVCNQILSDSTICPPVAPVKVCPPQLSCPPLSCPDAVDKTYKWKTYSARKYSTIPVYFINNTQLGKKSKSRIATGIECDACVTDCSIKKTRSKNIEYRSLHINGKRRAALCKKY